MASGRIRAPSSGRRSGRSDLFAPTVTQMSDIFTQRPTSRVEPNMQQVSLALAPRRSSRCTKSFKLRWSFDPRPSRLADREKHAEDQKEISFQKGRMPYHHHPSGLPFPMPSPEERTITKARQVGAVHVLVLRRASPDHLARAILKVGRHGQRQTPLCEVGLARPFA